MLLRSVIEHVKAQNWLAITIDFLIVVIGVFVGIQVSNWNDDRIARAAAVEFHGRLVEDLRLEAINYNSIQDYYRDVRAAAWTSPPFGKRR